MNQAAPQTLAILKLSSLGDILHALPAGLDLRRRFPDARLLWIAEREYVELLRSVPWIDGVLGFDRGGGWRAWRALRAEARAQRIDAIFDLQGNWKSASVALFSGARRRFGLARKDQREPGCFVLFHERATPAPRPHAIDRARHAVASWTASAEPGLAPAWSDVLPDDPQASAIAAQELAAIDLPSRSKLILLLPSPRPDPRAWPLAHWIELARHFSKQSDVIPLVVIGPSEQALGALMAAQFSDEERGARGVRFIPSRSGPRATIAALRMLAPRVQAAVASDGGALHLAVASGLRTIVLAGPQDPLRTGPYGADHVRLQARVELACRPCLARQCRLAAGPRCLDELSVDDVIRAIERTA